VLYPLQAVLDTGAGINLVRDDVLPAYWENMLLPDVAFPRITNASGRRIPARGVLILCVQVGNLLKRVRFYVTPGLGVPCILGCTFINLHVKSIHPKEWRVDLNEGGFNCHHFWSKCLPSDNHHQGVLTFEQGPYRTTYRNPSAMRSSC
jgi:hypothetical protein